MKKILLLSVLFFVVPVVGMKSNNELIQILSKMVANGSLAGVNNPLVRDFDSFCHESFLDATAVFLDANGRMGPGPTRGALLSACTKGDFELVKKLVEGGADLEKKDSTELITLGATPLMHACRIGNIEIVKYLIDKGALLDAQDNDGRTCLHYACRAIGSYLDLIKHLIKCGVDMNVKSGGENILHEICRTFVVHMGNGRERVAEYIEYFVEVGVNFYENNNYERTPYSHLRTKDKHLLREKFDCKLMNNILLMGLGHTFDKNSMLNVLPSDVMNEIGKRSVGICLSSAQAQIWKPVCKKAHELNNQLYCVKRDESNETLNIVRILTWPKEKREVISKKLMDIEKGEKEINSKNYHDDFHASQLRLML